MRLVWNYRGQGKKYRYRARTRYLFNGFRIDVRIYYIQLRNYPLYALLSYSNSGYVQCIRIDL